MLWRRVKATFAVAVLGGLGGVAGLGMTAEAAQGQAGAETGRRIGSVQEALSLSGPLSGSSGPASVNWMDGGDRFTYTVRSGSGSEVRTLDPGTLAEQALFDARALTLPGTGEPLQYRSFQFGQDSRHLLFQANFRPIYRHSGVADYYIYSLDGEELRLGVRDARTAELSPDGGLLGFERGGNLWVRDLSSPEAEERRLTDVDGDSIFNGVFDWVYEEEFGLQQAWAWSPDSRRIAFWQTDERGVPPIRLTDWEGHYPDWFQINYPKVGAKNPGVRIGVLDVGTGEQRWMDVGLEEEHYVPRIYWTSDPDLLGVVTLNRAQNHMQLFFFDVRTGERRKVMEERSDTWIDVYDFFAGILHFLSFPDGRREFFWISDRDGFNHIYRYGYDGELLNQVTRGEWAVTRVEGIDAENGTIYYTSTEVSPLERHLYAIGFDGGNKRRLTTERGTHRIDMSPNTRYYIDRWSNAETPPRVELWTTEDGGRRVQVLEDNAAVDRLVAELAYSPVELFRFTTSDGVELDGSMIRPPDFDETRQYPVLVSIYGGPGSQQVYDSWGSNGWHQYLAQQGYVVVGLNNRGTGNYGRDFMKIVYGELGRWEARDFAELGEWLASRPWVDGERLAIHGTSYGGFMTLATMVRHPGVYALGMANSPVTDWRLYDTIYTERYMGLLPENEDGYERTSLIPWADRLEGYLLLVHSGLDENVHPQHTMQFLTALARAGKDAEVRFFPPGAHGAAFDAASYVTMTEVYTNLLCEHIATQCVPMDLNR